MRNLYLKEIDGLNITDVGANRRRCCSCGPCCSIPWKDFVDTGNYGVKYTIDNAYDTEKIEFHDEMFYGAITADGMVYYSCISGSPIEYGILSGTVSLVRLHAHLLSNGLRNSDAIEFKNPASAMTTTNIPYLSRAPFQNDGMVFYNGESSTTNEMDQYNTVYTRASASIQTGCSVVDLNFNRIRAKTWTLKFSILQRFYYPYNITNLLNSYGYDHNPSYNGPYYIGSIWSKQETTSNGITFNSWIYSDTSTTYTSAATAYGYMNVHNFVTLTFYDLAELYGEGYGLPVMSGYTSGSAQDIIDKIPFTINPSFNPTDTVFTFDWWNLS